jgi:Zn-dependent peptidase ImmA (M78 family)
VKVPWLQPKEIAAAADELRERTLGARADELPVDLDAIVFDYLCEHEHLVFSDEAELGSSDSEEVLGKTELFAGRIHIARGLRALDLGRYRFTVAHELGHWVLHRPVAIVNRDHPNLFGEGGVVVSTQRLQSLNSAAAKSSVEFQANAFASHLLLPRRLLRSMFSARFGSVPQSPHGSETKREVGRRLARTDLSMPSLTTCFGTSVEATAIALEECGLVVDTFPLL